ncbi:MAG: Ig-like domain-containing protein, partial [Tannerellaceae bacterium]|nr:Ig-like domain-containing protein [Tannerellaceae bacterium]
MKTTRKAKKLFICMFAFTATLITGCSDDDEGEKFGVISVELNKDSMFLKSEQSQTLTATITPENATNKSVTWSSSKPEVATVDENGKV